VSSPSLGEARPTKAAHHGPMEGKTRTRTGAPPSKDMHSLWLWLYSYVVCRTGGQGGHVNGEGNYGFCGPDCPAGTDSSKISARINLVVNDAIMFEENTNLAPT
jgi:hypothetical protein